MEVPFGLTKSGIMGKDNPNVYEIHDQVCKCPYAREIKFIQAKFRLELVSRTMPISSKQASFKKSFQGSKHASLLKDA